MEGRDAAGWSKAGAQRLRSERTSGLAAILSLPIGVDGCETKVGYTCRHGALTDLRTGVQLPSPPPLARLDHAQGSPVPSEAEGAHGGPSMICNRYASRMVSRANEVVENFLSPVSCVHLALFSDGSFYVGWTQNLDDRCVPKKGEAYLHIQTRSLSSDVSEAVQLLKWKRFNGKRITSVWSTRKKESLIMGDC